MFYADTWEEGVLEILVLAGRLILNENTSFQGKYFKCIIKIFSISDILNYQMEKLGFDKVRLMHR